MAVASAKIVEPSSAATPPCGRRLHPTASARCPRTLPHDRSHPRLPWGFRSHRPECRPDRPAADTRRPPRCSRRRLRRAAYTGSRALAGTIPGRRTLPTRLGRRTAGALGCRGVQHGPGAGPAGCLDGIVRRPTPSITPRGRRRAFLCPCWRMARRQNDFSASSPPRSAHFSLPRCSDKRPLFFSIPDLSSQMASGLISQWRTKLRLASRRTNGFGIGFGNIRPARSRRTRIAEVALDIGKKTMLFPPDRRRPHRIAVCTQHRGRPECAGLSYRQGFSSTREDAQSDPQRPAPSLQADGGLDGAAAPKHSGHQTERAR